MSVESVRAYLGPFGVADKIIEFDQSSATVELAARDLGCEPARIAKTMACARTWTSRCAALTACSPRREARAARFGLTLPELERCSASEGWVDVCKDWREETA